jgi:hypothetical protein
MANNIYFIVKKEDIGKVQLKYPKQETYILVPTAKKNSSLNLYGREGWDFKTDALYTSGLSYSKKFRDSIFTILSRFEGEERNINNFVTGLKNEIQPHILNPIAHQFAYFIWHYVRGTYNYFLNGISPIFCLDSSAPISNQLNHSDVYFTPEFISNQLNDSDKIVVSPSACVQIFNIEYPSRFLVDLFHLLDPFLGGPLTTQLYLKILHNTYAYRLMEYMGFGKDLDEKIKVILRMNGITTFTGLRDVEL